MTHLREQKVSTPLEMIILYSGQTLCGMLQRYSG